MPELEKIPDLKKATFDKWADEIIAKYKIKDDTNLEIITDDVAKFFDKLFKNYQISFTDLHPDGIFPFAINKTDRKPGYADEEFYDELFKVENHLRWTYTIVLTKLYRDKECPFDTIDCPY
ncbi:MAG: hypothetical protein ACTSPT_04745 [Candidatus Heimdallarchaeota archaeon]